MTDDERHEIAERLRKVEVDEPANLYEAFDFALSVLDELLLDVKTSTTWRELFARIADLIDEPTCRLVEDGDGRTACSECGCGYIILQEAAFCPDCGARIIGRWWE